MAKYKFPKVVYVTRDEDQEFLMADSELDKIIDGPTHYAVYTLTEVKKAQLVVQDVD
jgi:hypothetical protein